MRVSLYTAPSPIHGIGTFTATDIPADTPLMRAIQGNRWYGTIQSPARFVNHAWEANMHPVWDRHGMWLVTSWPLSVGTEVTVDYRDMPWYIARPDPAWR